VNLPDPVFGLGSPLMRKLAVTPSLPDLPAIGISFLGLGFVVLAIEITSA
jgi:hypothetical protein